MTDSWSCRSCCVSCKMSAGNMKCNKKVKSTDGASELRSMHTLTNHMNTVWTAYCASDTQSYFILTAAGSENRSKMEAEEGGLRKTWSASLCFRDVSPVKLKLFTFLSDKWSRAVFLQKWWIKLQDFNHNWMIGLYIRLHTFSLTEETQENTQPASPLETPSKKHELLLQNKHYGGNKDSGELF